MLRSAVRTALFTVLVTALVGLVAMSLVAAGQAPVRSLPHAAVSSGGAAPGTEDTVVFAGGCFWGVQAVFEHVKGVKRATAGYAGGPADAATYEQVSTGSTGHAESVRVVFDPSVVSFGQLLEVFFSVAHDPTQLNRQGPDVGSQYRSAVFVTTDDQQRVATAYIDQLTAARTFDRPIVTQVVPLRGFYPAESYHQDYVKYHAYEPYVAFNDLPKISRLKKAFPALYH